MVPRKAGIACALLAAALVLAARRSPAAEPAGETELSEAQVRKLERLLFDCHLRLGLRKQKPAEAAGHLTQAESSAKWFKKHAVAAGTPEEKKHLESACSTMARQLAAAYGQAAEQARGRKDAEAARRFEDKHIEWLTKTAGKEQALYIAGKLRERGEHAGARSRYLEFLKRRDPEGRGQGVADQQLIGWKQLDEALPATEGLTSVGKVQEARKQLESIWLSAFGRPGKGREGRDLAAAVGLIDRFLKGYPGYGAGGPARTGIEKLKAELELRRELVAARCGLAECCRKLGEKEQAAGRKGPAGELFREGAAAAAKVLEHRPRGAGLRYDHGVCLLGSGRAAEAVQGLGELRRGLAEGSDLWWQATRKLHQAFTAAGQREAAKRLRERIKLDYPEDIKTKWPEDG